MTHSLGDSRSKVDLFHFLTISYYVGRHSGFHHASLHDRLDAQWMKTECNDKQLLIGLQFEKVRTSMSILDIRSLKLNVLYSVTDINTRSCIILHRPPCRWIYLESCIGPAVTTSIDFQNTFILGSFLVSTSTATFRPYLRGKSRIRSATANFSSSSDCHYL